MLSNLLFSASLLAAPTPAGALRSTLGQVVLALLPPLALSPELLKR